MSDLRDPLSYRGIALSCAMYKIYCSILNDRISKWAETNNVLVDEQNGFRKNRSTVDQISSLTNIIDTRKKAKKSTFCAFIDFKKAYDFISRGILWNKLCNTNIGLNGKILSALKSLYRNVTSSVRVNGHYTDWFDVKCGLRQGCSLSPLLFHLYINDLAIAIKTAGKGISIENELLCILLYADDIVLIAENEEDLQFMLDILHNWCDRNNMIVNPMKSNIVHFRPSSVPRTANSFTCGIHNLKVVANYTYLGLLLTEFLDFNLMAKSVAQSAGRALGLLIAKFKSYGGFPYKVFMKLYESTVWPFIAYGASVWGNKSYACINSVQARAMRFFLGMGRYTPTNALYGEFGWQPPHVKQWRCVAQHWYRLKKMDISRTNFKIFQYCDSKGTNKCRNWQYVFRKHLELLNLQHLVHDCTELYSRDFYNKVVAGSMDIFTTEWNLNIRNIAGPSGRGNNKLRTYKHFKVNYGLENYVACAFIPRKHKTALAKFRCGVAPIRLETGRYENIKRRTTCMPYL